MENKVGDTLPASTELAKLVKTVEDLNEKLRKFCINLLPQERQGLTRGRRGSEVYLAQMAELAKKYGFNVPGVTPEGLINDLRTERELAPLEQALEQALELVRDTRAQAASEANEAGYVFYAIGQGLGERIPELRAQIKSFAEFLSTRSRRRKPGAEPGTGDGSARPS